MQGKDIGAVRRLRAKLLANQYRPKYHVVSPEGSSIPFDPNGAIYYKGRYHLFYIFQDEGIHKWGHISSHDLLHWIQHPTALSPDDQSPEEGIFSGSAFTLMEDGTPLLMYHGVNAGNCVAIADDASLNTWTKMPANPIVKIPLPSDKEYHLFTSWDPHAWQEKALYRAIFGGPEPAMFVSKDLTTWTYQGPFVERGQRLNQGYEDYSCPDFFALGDKHIFMFISHTRGVQYYVGRYEDGVFTPEKHERMNQYGGQFFANESLLGPGDRRILWGWITEARQLESLEEEEFSGVLSLPRVLKLGIDGLVDVSPVEELKQLRAQVLVVGTTNLKGRKRLSLRGRQLEVVLSVSSNDLTKAGVVLCLHESGKEETLVYYDFETQEVVVDTSRASLRKDLFAPVKLVDGLNCPREAIEARRASIVKEIQDNAWLPVPEEPTRQTGECYVQRLRMSLREGKRIDLRIFLDASVIEVFVNNSKCLSQRVYPSFSESDLVALFSEGGESTFHEMSVWKLAPTNAR